MNIKRFGQIDKRSVLMAGGKGASLGEMTMARIPVPPGFVVLAASFDRFLDETDLLQDVRAQLKKVNYKDINSVDRYSNVIRAMMAKVEFPKGLGSDILENFDRLKSKYVAVRSSATAEDSKTASWAGELETYLNTTRKDLLDNVRKCWSSLFTPRAIFYRREKKLHNSQVSVAVVVQVMVQSEISGITFTVHPVTQDRNQMIIEVVYGLGETIVSGMVTPDSYVLSKKDNMIIDINVEEQKKMLVLGGRDNKMVAIKKTLVSMQKLTGKQIVELAELCKRVEKHYGFPVDIEWARARGKFYILQSRPITTLK